MQSSLAEMIAKGSTRVKTVFNIYHQNSNDGKQVFDNSGREEANVIEPMIFVEHQITEDTAITGHFVFDFWTAASDTKVDGSTGASGAGRGTQTRVSGSLGFKREVGKLSYSSAFGFSSEYDYKSLNGSFNIARSFAKDNFTLGFGAQYYADKVNLFQDLTPAAHARISDDLPRKIIALSLTGSQILTAKDIIQFSATYVQAKENLESTASSVLISGVRESEQLPKARKRYAFSTHWVHGPGESTALHTSYRYYFDQWKLKAHTLRIGHAWEINDEEDILELFARYHSQSKVEYFKAEFVATEEFMTSDSDLAKFSSYEGGIYYSQSLADKDYFGLNFSDVRWDNSLVYSTRTNGLRFAYWQTSLGFEF